MISWLLLIVPEAPEVKSLWPTSLIGLVGSLTGLIGFAVLMYEKVTGKGRKLEAIDNSIKDLSARMGVTEVKISRIDDLTTEIDHEVRGVAGTNGIKAAVRECRVEIEKIHVLNRKNEILRARFKEIMRQYEGPERREGMRGLKELFRDSDQE